MKARINAQEIARKLRGEGVNIPVNAAVQMQKELGIGRYLRTPNMGWVLDRPEAEQLENALRERYAEPAKRDRRAEMTFNEKMDRFREYQAEQARRMRIEEALQVIEGLADLFTEEAYSQTYDTLWNALHLAKIAENTAQDVYHDAIEQYLDEHQKQEG